MTSLKKHKIKFNLLLNIFRMVLMVLVPLITFPYLTRIFLADGMGKINFAISVANMLTLFATLGVYTYGLRQGSLIRENKAVFSNFVYEILLINFIATLLTYLFFIICLNSIPVFIDNCKLLLIYSMAVFFSAVSLDWVFGVYEDYLYITKRQIFAQLTLIVLMLLLVKKQEDIYLWAIVCTLVTIVINICNFGKLKKYIYIKKPNFKKLILLQHIKPITVLFITQLAAKTGSDLNIIMIGLMSTNRETGLYSIVAKVINILITCFAAMTPVLVPKIVSLINLNNNQAIKFIHKIFRLILFISLPAAIGLYALSDEIIYIIAGENFVEAAVTLRILAPVIVFSALNSMIYYNYFVPLHLEKYVLCCTSITLISNLIFNYWLINLYASNGAAVSYCIAELLGLISAIYISNKKCNTCICDFSVLHKYFIGTFLIFIYVSFIKFLEIKIVVLTLFLSIIGSIFLYFIIMYLFRDEFILDVISIINKWKRG